MKKTKLSSYFVFIAFFTLITILVAIIQKSYANLIDPINKVANISDSKIIDPQLDLDIIEDIEKKPLNFDETSLFTNNSEKEATASQAP